MSQHLQAFRVRFGAKIYLCWKLKKAYEIEIKIDAFLRPSGEAPRGRLVWGPTLPGRLLDNNHVTARAPGPRVHVVGRAYHGVSVADEVIDAKRLVDLMEKQWAVDYVAGSSYKDKADEVKMLREELDEMQLERQT